MADLRVGVVGLGIGQAHLLGWRDVDGASVVAVADTDVDRLASVTAAWELPGVPSLDALLELGVDVVDVCTPPAIHEAQILRCLDAGVHVICEKPLVDSVAACHRIAVAADAARSASRARLMPVFQYRFGEGAFRARALVDAGLTGRLYAAEASTWWRRGADYYAGAAWRGTWAGERGGTILTHAIHNHDLLCWIGGPLAEIGARTATRVNPVETDDCAVAWGRTEDGALVTMNVTLGAGPETSRLRWAFEHVLIESSHRPYDPGAGPWTFEFHDESTAVRAAEAWARVETPEPLYAGQFQAFVERVADDGPLPVEVADARRSLELVTAWYRSTRDGTVESLPLSADHPDLGSWRPDGA